MGPHKFIVDFTVRCGNNYHINTSHKPGCEAALALVHFAVIMKLHDIRVIEHSIGSRGPQPAYDTDCRRLTAVINIRLIRNAEYKYP